MEKQRCSMAFWGSCVLLATVQVKAPMAHTLEISEVTAAGLTGGTWLDLELLTASISVSLFWWVSRCRNIIPTREHCQSAFHLPRHSPRTVPVPPNSHSGGRRQLG